MLNRAMRWLVLVCGLMIALGASPARAQDWSKVPGVAIAYLESPDRVPLLGYPYPWDEAYLGSPSITILDDGTYIATHDVFGLGTNENTTWVYRSTNKGASWTQLGSVNNFWSTVFSIGNTLYLMGPTEGGDNGDLVIRKSTDKGNTWTSTVILDGDYGGTPNSPVFYDNRIWIASGTANAMSAPLSSDLMNAASWTRSNGESTAAGEAYFGSDWQGWSEGQIVGSPEMGVYIMPKVRALPYAGLIKVTSPTNTTMSPEQFVSLPGAEKKFGVKYDEVSGKFYALTNLVLPTDADGVHSDEPELIRSTGSLFSSTDLVHWDLEQIFLYTRNKDTAADSTGWGEGYQYFQCAIDGNDMAVVSRTSLDVGDGQNDPPRAHDSNLITFHKIDNFRTATPKFVLVADPKANRVMRYEYANTNHLAPIGKFNLGSTYDGVALDTPMGVAQTANGDVYVTEDREGGRILRFDSAGNYLETVATSGTDFTGNPHQLTVGPDGNLYMTCSFGSGSDKVYKINPQTGAVSVFIPTNFATGESFDNPRGLTFAGDGNLYVADRENNCIRKFDANGNYLGKIAVGQNRPQALTWDAKNNRLIFSRETTTGDNDIARVTLGGSVLTLYTDTDVGFCIGATTINGQVFWSDYTNGELYASTNEANKEKTTSASKNLTGTAQMTTAFGPGRENRSWIVEGASHGDWADPYNWYYFTRPDTNDEIAHFGSANTAFTTAYADIQAGETFTVKGLRFNSSNRYIVDGAGALILEADTGHAIIDVQQGSHWVRVNTTLNSDTDMSVASGQRFEFRAGIDFHGKTLFKTGQGILDFDTGFTLNGGTLKTDGLSPINFSTPTTGTYTLNGNFEFAPDPSLSLTLGTVVNLHDGTSNLAGAQFNKIIMPQLANLLGWDLSDFYTSVGYARVIQVLNPEWGGDFSGDWSDIANWANYARPDSNVEIAHFKAVNTTTRYARIADGQTVTVKGLNFNSAQRYIVDNQSTSGGTGALDLSAGSGSASINVQQGSHWIRVDTRLLSNTDVSVTGGADLSFRDVVNLNGKTLSKTGSGSFSFYQGLSLNGGTLKTDGLAPIYFAAPTTGTYALNGNFEFAPDPSLSLTLGTVVNLHDGTNNLAGAQFNKIIMPQLANLLGWDMTDFYTSSGFARVIAVVSPEWGADASGDWNDIAAWAHYARPDSNYEIASFKAVTTGTRYAYINAGQTFTVKGLDFDSPNRYIIDGSGALNLDADTGRASITVRDGSQWVRVDTKLFDHTDIIVPYSGDELSFRDSLDLNGKTVYKTGIGKLSFYGTLNMNGGTFVTDGLSPLTFLYGSSSTLNGNLQFTPDAGLALTAGSSYNLIDGESYLAGQTFNSIVLPTAPNATGWDTGTFYNDGKVKLISVPAPTWTKTSSGNWTDAINWQYSCRPDSNLEIAAFASAITSASTVTLNSTYAVKGLRFNNANKYTLTGSGAINIDADSGHAVIDVQAGSHEVQVPIKLYDITDATLAANTSLLLSGALDLNGQTLNIAGSGFLLCTALQTSNGTINLTDSALGFNSGYLNLTAGSALTGTGAVHGVVLSNGRIAPGHSTGALWINGGFAQGTSGQLDIELTYAGLQDSLSVIGVVTLDGKLKLSLLDGYVPSAGSSFTILSAQSLSGTFAAIEGMNVNSNLSLAVTYSATTVKVTAALPGDANFDGLVNLADLQILGDHWSGTSLSWALGDFNGDGKVNLSDLQIVGDHWGGSAADFAAFAATIPEPSGLFLLSVAGLTLLRRRVKVD